MNPVYERLARIAYDTVIATMVEGEKTHPEQDWKTVSIYKHRWCAAQHADNALVGNKTGEDDMGHCLTRCAMVKAIEKDKQISQID